MSKTYSVALTLEELLLLDSKVSDKAQTIIDGAKKESTYGFDLPVMNEILKKSEETGKLTWRHKQIRSCSYCDKKYDYYTYPRSGRYHNKGDKNHNKPKYYSGIAFNEGFVTFEGYGDMCSECASKHNVIHRLIDYVLENDLKIEIQKNDYKFTKYLKDEIKICYKCKKEMQESKMGKLSALMGGYYPGECPHCGAKALAFGNSHGITKKFVMILNPLYKHQEEINKVKEVVYKYNQEHDKDKINFGQSYNNQNSFYVMVNATNSPSLLKFSPIIRKYVREFDCRRFPEQTKLIEDLLLEFNYIHGH